MPPDDGLVAVGARRYEVDRHSADFLHPAEIGLRRRRQVAEARDAHRARLPSRQLLVDGLAFGQEIGAVIERRKDAAGQALDEAAVQAWFKRKGVPWEKSPKVVKFVDAIPKTATGKDQRLKFAPLFEGLYETQFKPSEAWKKA